MYTYLEVVLCIHTELTVILMGEMIKLEQHFLCQ